MQNNLICVESIVTFCKYPFKVKNIFSIHDTNFDVLQYFLPSDQENNLFLIKGKWNFFLYC